MGIFLLLLLFCIRLWLPASPGVREFIPSFSWAVELALLEKIPRKNQNYFYLFLFFFCWNERTRGAPGFLLEFPKFPFGKLLGNPKFFVAESTGELGTAGKSRDSGKNPGFVENPKFISAGDTWKILGFVENSGIQGKLQDFWKIPNLLQLETPGFLENPGI